MMTLLGKLNLLFGELLFNSFQESITVKRGVLSVLKSMDCLHDPPQRSHCFQKRIVVACDDIEKELER